MPGPINDAHVHFFSQGFFAGLGRQVAPGDPDPGAAALDRLGWDAPGTPEALADRWSAELDRHGVARAALIASLPSDAGSVAAAVARHPARFVGFLMVDPTAPSAAEQAAAALDDGFRTLCLFPGLHGYRLDDPRARSVVEVAAARPGAALFVHCGVLSIGVRRKLGLPNTFPPVNPLEVQPLAAAVPHVPVIVPHFGAGFFREALMLGDTCANVYLDTSSSNGWMRYHPGLALPAVIGQVLKVLGPERLLFGSDSSFFPRGWVRDVHQAQLAALAAAGADDAAVRRVCHDNFDRLFPPPAP